MISCKEQQDFNVAYGAADHHEIQIENSEIITGAERTASYIPLLQNKNVGLVINHTSKVDHRSLLDTLQSLEISVKAIFAPEHGLKGVADAGEKIENGKYRNIPVYSLYGKTKKPKAEWLDGLDILVFDIQDVGARFYTYISTLHYVMQAASESGVKVIVLDRPNPNGFYVDGPVLQNDLQSFVGMHPVPVVHGMTIGEYAQMINGEQWLDIKNTCQLEVITCKNYDHTMTYDLPIKPSPNLPNWRSVLLYPSLCFFEGTTMSIGRGTHTQFQVIGHPALSDDFGFSFTPKSSTGSKYPKHENEVCYGQRLESTKGDLIAKAELDISYLISYYHRMEKSNVDFFNDNNFFDKLAGTYALRKQIQSGMSETEIRQTWQADLDAFKLVRKKYLLYPDFE